MGGFSRYLHTIVSTLPCNRQCHTWPQHGEAGTETSTLRPRRDQYFVLVVVQAERKRLFFSREGTEPPELTSQVAALEIGGQFLFDMAEHRDFLGSVLGTGITRDAVGGGP